MNNSIYITLSKQTALFRQMDVVANNIANSDTAGFKSDAMLFQDYLVQNGKYPDPQGKLAFTHDMGLARNLNAGEMKITDRPLDVAVDGNGYFAVQTPGGERYTRAGNFHINADGTLVTQQGDVVLNSDGQPISFQPEDTTITIGENGIISSNGQDISRLGIVQFDNERFLQKTGNNLYSATTPPIPAQEGYRVVQGALEGSNVVPVKELVAMIDVQRAATSTSNLISQISDMVSNAVTTIAKPA